MKIAIVGAGISGLTAAHYLHQKHEITIFEANTYIGGHANTVDVEVDGELVSVDTGFVVFNDRTYPNFCRILSELGVAAQPTSMSFSVRCDQSGLEYQGSSLNGLFAQRSNLLRPRFLQMLWDWRRFSRLARRVIDDVEDETPLRAFLAKHRFSHAFVRDYLYPMGSAIWSCPREAFGEFPLRFVAEFYEHHGLLDLRGRPKWFVIKGGSRTYVDALIRPFASRIRTSTHVSAVRRCDDKVHLQLRGSRWEDFDHAIIAVHADQALRIIGDCATSTERDVLLAFPYEENVAVLHTDVALLPSSRRAWAAWNYLMTADLRSKPSVTYNMSLLQSINTASTICVTLNNESRINPTKILKRFTYDHPVFNCRRRWAQSQHSELIDQRRLSFCGAYWRNGFHEDGVVSAIKVCETLMKKEGLCKAVSTKEKSTTKDSSPWRTSSNIT